MAVLLLHSNVQARLASGTNIDLAAQYTGYGKFNGASTNYDGAGRDATGNNSVYLLARFVF